MLHIYSAATVSSSESLESSIPFLFTSFRLFDELDDDELLLDEDEEDELSLSESLSLLLPLLLLLVPLSLLLLLLLLDDDDDEEEEESLLLLLLLLSTEFERLRFTFFVIISILSSLLCLPEVMVATSPGGNSVLNTCGLFEFNMLDLDSLCT